MKTDSLMARENNNRWSDFPVSRDWADIDCLASSCRYNSNLKCGVPSRAKFNDKAQCEGYENALTKDVLSKKIDGD